MIPSTPGDSCVPTAYRIHSEVGVHSMRFARWPSSSVSERSTITLVLPVITYIMESRGIHGKICVEMGRRWLWEKIAASTASSKCSWEGEFFFGEGIRPPSPRPSPFRNTIRTTTAAWARYLRASTKCAAAAQISGRRFGRRPSASLYLVCTCHIFAARKTGPCKG